MAEQTVPLTNGDTVITNDDRRSLQFNIKDLYKYRDMDSGSEIIKGTGSYVPREDDSVIDWDNGFKRVSRVDQTTFVADLVSWDIPNNEDDVDDEDKLLGGGPGRLSESFRVYIDTRVTPHRLDICSRLHAYGEQAKSVIVFKGSDTSKLTGEIISAMYAQNGDYQGPEIPLSLAWTKDANNRAIKAPVMGYTNHDLPDGQPVTVVTYNQADAPTDIARCLVHNTNVVRHPYDDMEKITSVELISPYLSAAEPNTLEVPINVTAATLTMRAKVTYDSGRFALVDVVDEDANGKCKLVGLKYWSPAITGTPYELTLTYEPDPNAEYAYMQGVTANGRVQVPYKLIGLPVDPTRSLKLFAFPTWVSDVAGYALDFWMYDLTRSTAYRVPKAAVELDALSPAFDGLNYTSTQTLTFGVDLKQLDSRYGNERHAQIVQIALLRSGGTRASNWKVKFANNQKQWFGDGLEAVVRSAGAGLSTVDISQGEQTQAAWLQKVFYYAEPLYDPQTETVVPAPTHFTILTKTQTFKFPISQWNTAITFVNDLAEGATMFIRWTRELTAGTLQLGVTGLPVHKL